MLTKRFLLLPLMAALLSAGLCGCQADADGSISAGPNGNGTGTIDSDDGIDDNGTPTGSGGNDDTGFPNDGTAGGNVVEDDGTGTDVQIAGDDVAGRFVCTATMQIQFGASTDVGVNGLVGSDLSGLVDSLGGQGVTNLLNSINDKDLAIDGTLTTAAVYNLTASALGIVTTVNSLDLNVYPPQGVTIAAGDYAVFAISAPPGLANVALMATATVTTYQDDVEQEQGVPYDVTQLSLLGTGVLDPGYVYLGRKVTKPYNRAVLSLTGDVLSLYTGDAMFAHEMCVKGTIVGA